MAHPFYEFFAGGGMARAGLGPQWSCVFANDFDPKKGKAYAANWGADHLVVGDVGKVKPRDLPGQASLAWASFPCQDLSLAGAGAGLDGERSGTFWLYWRLIQKLQREGRAPRLIVLENVYGAITSHGGDDFTAITTALAKTGYRFGAVVVDAALFVPQSRPRLFVIGIRSDLDLPAHVAAKAPTGPWYPTALLDGIAGLPKQTKAAALWWRLPVPAARRKNFVDIIEASPKGIGWHTQEETNYLLSLMSPLNLAKVTEARKAKGRKVGGVYRRTRDGKQRAEVRFDDIAGCLRTPTGGSSRQTILVVENGRVRSRLLSPREAARLMGLPDKYRLPQNYNETYHLVGDGVAVPVVRHLARNILEPILEFNVQEEMEAA